MNSIWKFPLVMGEDQWIKMPRGSRVLTLQMQGATPTLWALVQPEASVEVRQFIVVGTGWEFDANDGMQYVGTWQDGGFVWHLFERTK